jgi:hypothetical protein
MTTDMTTDATTFPRRAPTWLPRPFELLALAAALATLLFLRARGIRLGGSALAYLVDATLHRLPVVVLLGVSLQLLGHLFAWRSPASWLRAVTRPAALLLWGRILGALVLLNFAYWWLKVNVPLLRADLLDRELWRLDQWLHFGVSPAVFAAELLAGTPAAGWIDRWYFLWLTTVVAMQSAVFLSARADRRRNFAFACLALWVAGAWLYVALPAVGPAFAVPEAFREALAGMPHATDIQRRLWANYLEITASRSGVPLPPMKPFLAVAAMPSLHVGAHWLFALWARRRAPRLFVPWAAATALTFFGSLATGWHYAVDGYAGMLLAWGAIRLADRFEPVADAAGSGVAPDAPQGKDGVGDQQAGDQREGDEHHAEGRLDAEHRVPSEQ